MRAVLGFNKNFYTIYSQIIAIFYLQANLTFLLHYEYD